MIVDQRLADSFDRKRIASLAAAIACIMAVGVGLSLSVPLLSFALDAKGASRTMIGLNTAMGGIAAIAVAPFVSRLAQRYGVRATLAAGAALGVASLLGFLAVEPLWAWFALRFTFSASLTVLFVLSEYWINEAAPQTRRGLVMGVYATALSLGFAAGPQALRLVGTEGPEPFLAGAALFALAALPVAFARGLAPGIHDEPSRRFATFLWAAPAATLAALVFGAAETAALALVPLYGSTIGLDAGGAATLISIVALGNLAFQIPLGLIADRIDKRLVLLICGVTGAGGMAALVAFDLSQVQIQALLFVWGGIVAGLYTVGLAHLGSRFKGADLAQANAAFVVMYSVGMVIGPPLAGFGMDLWPPHGLPATLGALFAIYAAVVALRMAGRRAA